MHPVTSLRHCLLRVCTAARAPCRHLSPVRAKPLALASRHVVARPCAKCIWRPNTSGASQGCYAWSTAGRSPPAGAVPGGGAGAGVHFWRRQEARPRRSPLFTGEIPYGVGPCVSPTQYDVRCAVAEPAPPLQASGKQRRAQYRLPGVAACATSTSCKMWRCPPGASAQRHAGLM